MKRKALVAELKAFYIMETEASLRQFRQLLGDTATESVFQRLVENDRRGWEDDSPIRGVTVFEAAHFCSELKKLDAADPRSSSGLEDRRFRLPSHREWQYACRAITDADRAMEKPHFNVWPKLATIEQSVLADCTDNWKKLGKTEPFTGSQEQVFTILKGIEHADTAIKILDAFLQKGLGTTRSYRNPELCPQPVGGGRPNAWNIFDMHGNVFEWTIAVKDGSEFEEITAKLESNDHASVLADNSPLFFLAGGGYNHSLARKPADWVKLTTWGGERLASDNTPAPYSPQEIEEDNVAQDFSPGFRVVLERVLASHWLLVIRKTALLNDNDQVAFNEIRQQLDQHRKQIAELAPPTKLDETAALVDYYEGLALQKEGQITDGVEIIQKQAEALAQVDPYFSYLKELMDDDLE
ncbi:hypothetical protein LCGC14_2439990 [marine sediment metagenome]|uniref:Sulfatase-modifying factor enzyme-like domain-containing protein n=1 Tax=marine sediment metagenome TaxID=412755 RepID=A0A0F9ED85_9ZZZZ